LSKQQKQQMVFYLASYVVALTSLINLGTLLGTQFGSTFEYVTLGVTLVFAALIVSAYLPEGRYKKWKSAKVSQLLRGAKALFALSCFLEVLGVYNVYFAGYIVGSQSHIVVLVKVLPDLLINSLYLIYLGVVVSLTGIAIGTFGFVAIAYRRGLDRVTTNAV